MAENLSFGAVGFALILDICLDGGGHSLFSLSVSSVTANGLIGCGPTTVVVATGCSAVFWSSSEIEGLRFRERGGSGTSGYRVENALRRADQSGRTVKSSLNTAFSIYWVVGEGVCVYGWMDEWVTGWLEVSWLEVESSGFCFVSAAGCHEKRGVRINMTNQRV